MKKYIVSIVFASILNSTFAGLEFQESDPSLRITSAPVEHKCPLSHMEMMNLRFAEHGGLDPETTKTMITMEHYKPLNYEGAYKDGDPLPTSAKDPRIIAQNKLKAVCATGKLPTTETQTHVLVNTALKAYSMVAEGDTVLFLGRSPSAFRYIFEQIEANRGGIPKNLNLMSVSFSGHPGISFSQRAEEDGTADCNVLTQEGLDWLYGYLDSIGLHNVNPDSKIHILDILNKGSSLNSFLQIIRKYSTHIGNPGLLSQLHFLGMIDERFCEEGTDQPYPDACMRLDGDIYDGVIRHWKWGNRKLAFAPGSEEKAQGYGALRIDAKFIAIHPEMINFFDDARRKECCSYGVQRLAACGFRGELPHADHRDDLWSISEDSIGQVFRQRQETYEANMSLIRGFNEIARKEAAGEELTPHEKEVLDLLQGIAPSSRR